MEKKLQSANIGTAGEHLVLAHLLRLNFVAGLAPYNTKDYDLIVVNKDGSTSCPIQVKTSMNKDGWMMSHKHEKPIDNLFYCFVQMYRTKPDTEIFVIDSKTVAHVVKMAHQIWLKIPGRKGRAHNQTSMRILGRDNRIAVGKTKNYAEFLNKAEIEFLEKYKIGWLEQYRDACSLLKQ